MYSICEPIRPLFTFPHWRQPVSTPDCETSSYTVDSTYPGGKTSSETAIVQPSVSPMHPGTPPHSPPSPTVS
ncbi:hypothetical protein BS47DRAFT_1349217 [Hydnum rufescens UP504]|uniref:Uncharacterized protein n=1 Tax=Hydnum rufescens UP504 TaxID=1448309 RepID=A0A9P6APS2_9AGAM|nr:hypothetical protein BS47DRAFT_1349217 [Hydnum rufescens UP504]